MIRDQDSSRGFRIAPGVLDESECVGLLNALDGAGLDRTRAGARHLLGVAPVQALAFDPRLRALAMAFLGGGAHPFRATLFDKSSAANWLVPWHQDLSLPLRRRFDAAGWGPWSLKAGVLQAHAPSPALHQVVALRVHLDDASHLNGPLRVLPGSHAHGVLAHEAIRALARRSRAVDCLVPRGGVLAMRPLLVHSSSKSRSSDRRRVLHVEYAASLDVGDGAELAVA